MKEQVHSIRIRSNVIVYTKHIRLRHFNIDDDLSLSLGQIRAVWPRISEKNFLRVSSYIMSVLNLVLTIFFPMIPFPPYFFCSLSVLPFSFAVAPVDRKKHVVRSRSPSFFSVPLTSALLPFLSLSPSHHRYVLSQRVVGLSLTPQSGSAPVRIITRTFPRQSVD